MQMRRKSVGIQQVLLPFACTIAGSVLVLIVWQVLDPLVWIRVEISHDPLETFGQCANSNGILPFVLPLAILIAFTIFMTCAISWKMKNVQSDLSEAKWVFFGVFVHLQVWGIGIPMLVITSQVSSMAQLIMMVGLTVVFSTSLTGLVIWPKIYQWAEQKVGCLVRVALQLIS
jgi:ABC-type multidrug transport system permease subunit